MLAGWSASAPIALSVTGSIRLGPTAGSITGDQDLVLGDHGLERPMSAIGVRRAKAALSSGCKPHPANAPAGSDRSRQGGNELAEAFDNRVTNR